MRGERRDVVGDVGQDGAPWALVRVDTEGVLRPEVLTEGTPAGLGVEGTGSAGVMVRSTVDALVGRAAAVLRGW